uniref:TF-B3 domain-containing protein n=1 Tax=Leersia perrieri TaxID=77586 RepID=A0A0D9UYM5_9ORYZ
MSDLWRERWPLRFGVSGCANFGGADGKKRGRPPGSQTIGKSKMDQKTALVYQRLALLDSSSSSSSSDKDDDFEPGAEAIDYDDMDDVVVVEAAPIKMLRPNQVDGEQRTVPAIPQTCYTQSTDLWNGLTNTIKGCCGSAMERAKELQTKLPAEQPSFVKKMLQSHVVRGFWLGLPADFCNKHLPKVDTVIVLEDENGNSYDTTYLGGKQGLSARWRGFALDHDIKVGDVVVYIVREKNLTTTDGVLGLMSLDACKKQKISKEERSDNAKSGEHPKTTTNSSKGDHNYTQNLVKEGIDGIRFSDSEIIFDDVTSLSNFNIIVDGLVIDCKFLDHQRMMYYELCCSQKSFLHNNLLKHLNFKLVVGVIMETINIAEGIRACKSDTSSHEDFLVWKKTLQSFELLGMKVAFLLKRVDDLLGLPAQPRDSSECAKYKEIKLARSRAGVKMKALESKLSSLTDELKKMDAEMEEMESSVRKHDVALKKIATAPW